METCYTKLVGRYENKDTQKIFLEDNIGFVEILETFGSDLTIVNAARVSFHKESTWESSPGRAWEGTAHTDYTLSTRDRDLIYYLARHRHTTPFFHPQIRMRIKMPIFVVREWYRHTVGFARNEMSRRYVTEDPQCFVPLHLRKRDKNVKQGSLPDLVDNNDVLVKQMKDFVAASCAYYNTLLDQGVCPEQARMILPQSMYVEFIETASLAGYARLAELRLGPAAQKEIREYAQSVSVLIEERFPVAWKALMAAQ